MEREFYNASGETGNYSNNNDTGYQGNGQTRNCQKKSRNVRRGNPDPQDRSHQNPIARYPTNSNIQEVDSCEYQMENPRNTYADDTEEYQHSNHDDGYRYNQYNPYSKQYNSHNAYTQHQEMPYNSLNQIEEKDPYYSQEYPQEYYETPMNTHPHHRPRGNTQRNLYNEQMVYPHDHVFTSERGKMKKHSLKHSKNDFNNPTLKLHGNHGYPESQRNDYQNHQNYGDNPHLPFRRNENSYDHTQNHQQMASQAQDSCYHQAGEHTAHRNTRPSHLHYTNYQDGSPQDGSPQDGSPFVNSNYTPSNDRGAYYDQFHSRQFRQELHQQRYQLPDTRFQPTSSSIHGRQHFQQSNSGYTDQAGSRVETNLLRDSNGRQAVNSRVVSSAISQAPFHPSRISHTTTNNNVNTNRSRNEANMNQIRHFVHHVLDTAILPMASNSLYRKII